MGTAWLHRFILKHLVKRSRDLPRGPIPLSVGPIPLRPTRGAPACGSCSWRTPSPALPTLPGPRGTHLRPEPAPRGFALSPAKLFPALPAAACPRRDGNLHSQGDRDHPRDALFWLLWNSFSDPLTHKTTGSFSPHHFPSPKQSCFPGCRNPLQPPEDQQTIFHSSLWFGEKKDLGSITIRAKRGSQAGKAAAPLCDRNDLIRHRVRWPKTKPLRR